MSGNGLFISDEVTTLIFVGLGDNNCFLSSGILSPTDGRHYTGLHRIPSDLVDQMVCSA